MRSEGYCRTWTGSPRGRACPHARSGVVLLVRTTSRFEILASTAVADKAVGIAAREGDEVRAHVAQLALEVRHLIGIVCSITTEFAKTNQCRVRG